MSRHAILIGNSVRYDRGSAYSVPKRVVDEVFGALAERLSAAQPEPYKVTKIIDLPMHDASAALKKALRAAGGDDNLALVLYFGHGVAGPDRRTLYLYFKDSEADDLPSMLPFSDVVSWADSYKVHASLFILDCCYAGLGAEPMNQLVQQFNRPYYLMAAVNAKERAAIEHPGDVPFGVFTRWLVSGFSDHAARMALSRRVTCQSLFDFMNAETLNRSSQVPFHVDGGLGDEVLWEQTAAAVVEPAIREAAPRKGLYRKLYAIGTALLTSEFDNSDRLHAFFKRWEREGRDVREMLTPVLTDHNVVEYQVVGAETLRGYLRMARVLGMVEQEDPVRLTATGKRMCRNSGARFNEEMCKALRVVWEQSGVDLNWLEETLGGIIRRGDVPSEDVLFWESYLSKPLSMSRTQFCTFLALSADAGLLNCSRKRTFFPTVGEDAQQVPATAQVQQLG